MKLRMRKLPVFVAALLAVVPGWLVLEARRSRGDEERYRQYACGMRLTHELLPLQPRLPSLLAKPLGEHLRLKTIPEIKANERALLASGYLTNVSFTLTNSYTVPPAGGTNTYTLMVRMMDEIGFRLHEAPSDYRLLPLSLEISSNRVSVHLECRPKDVGLYRQVLEKWTPFFGPRNARIKLDFQGLE